MSKTKVMKRKGSGWFLSHFLRRGEAVKRISTLALMLLLMPAVAWAQSVNISGTVRDASGEVLPGVSVVVKGTTVGAATSTNGVYSITAPANATLVFSLLGMATKEEAVGDRQVIDVVLSEGSEAIDEVVVIGYGTQRKEAVTGSVSTMRGDVIREVPSSNISQALQGRIAGVDMSQTSSKPGAEMQIRIRGTRSLNASNDPLVVLDGIPFAGSIGDINPNDIKSIDILKDASATAIYGSRGANGVILVTTSRGHGEAGGAGATVSYNGYYGIKTVFAPYPMMDGPSFVKLRQAAGRYNNSLDEFDDVNTDWQDLLYTTGIVTSHDVSVAGAAAKGTYNFSVGYYKDEAVLPGQDYNRISLRAAIDQEVGIFRFGVSSNSNYSLTNGSNLGIYSTLSASPIVDPWDENNVWKTRIRMPLDNQFAYSKEVVEGLGNSWVNQTKAFGSYNTLYGEVKIPGVEGLKFRTNLGLNFRMSNGGSYTGEGIFSDNATNPSSATVSNALTTNWASENMLTFDRTFADKHQINVVGMYSAEQTHYNRSYMAARDIPADQFQYYNLGRAAGEITVSPNDQSYQLSGLMSWMGRVMYSYDSRYMISATLRSDASSRLAEGHKWHTYPAISAGWNVKKESFMDNVDVLDALKIRVGYGQTSNQSINPYATLGLLSTRPYTFGSEGYTTGYYVSQLPNPNLGWEYSETLNFGIDFSLFKNRLSGTLEYYSQNTKDVLLNVSLPSSSGVSSYMANIGETENKGFEMSLNGVILDNYNGWSWDAGVNFYVNRNKLVSLASGQERDENNWWFVGHPIDVVYDFDKVGIWQAGDPYLDILEPGGNVGMIKVAYNGEYNADGTPVRRIGTADRIPIDMEPNFQGGFNTRVAYKGIDLSIVGAFKDGGKLISTLYTRSGYLNMLSGRRNNVDVDYWMPDNTDAKYPYPAGLVDGDAPKYGSTLGYFDASYLKIRTITLGYNFQPKLTKKFGVDRLRIYFTLQNPIVMFSPYYDESGMDPETNSYGDENQSVNSAYQSRLLVIGTNSPSTRNYLFGLNLTF